MFTLRRTMPLLASIFPLRFGFRVKGPPGRQGLCKIATARYIYKDAHTCQDNFAQHFADGRFVIFLAPVRTREKGVRRRLPRFRLPFRQHVSLLTIFRFSCKCPMVSFFAFRTKVEFTIVSVFEKMQGEFGQGRPDIHFRLFDCCALWQ